MDNICEIESIIDECIVVGKLLYSDNQISVYEAYDKILNKNGVLEVVNSDNEELKDNYKNKIRNEAKSGSNNSRFIYKMIEKDNTIYVFTDKAEIINENVKESDVEKKTQGDKLKKSRIKKLVKFSIAISLLMLVGIGVYFIIGYEHRGDDVIIDHIIWEGTNGKALTKSGKYQHDVNYFDYKHIEYVDVFERIPEDYRGIGTYTRALTEIKKLLDDTKIDYSIGTEDTGDQSIIIRLPKKQIGFDFIEMLRSYYKREEDLGVLLVKDGLVWRKVANVKYLLKDSSDIIIANKIKLKIGNDNGIENGAKVIWNFGYFSYSSSCLFGEYKDGVVTFSESTFRSDKAIPDEAKVYLRLFRAKLLRIEDVFTFNYSMKEPHIKTDDFGLDNELRECILSNISSAIERDTGIPVIEETNYSTNCLTFFTTDLDDSVAQKTIDIVEALTKHLEESDDNMYLGGNSEFNVCPAFVDGKFIWNTRVDYGEKTIKISYFEDNLKDIDKNLFERELDKYINGLHNLEYFKTYEIESTLVP